MRLTLNGVLWAAVIAMTGLLGLLYFQLDRTSKRSVEENARRLREAASKRVSADVENYLLQGEKVALSLEAQLRSGDCEGPAAESCLGAALIANPNLAEVTLTQGVDLGYDEDGWVNLAPEKRRLISLYRVVGEKSLICTREVTGSGANFVARISCRSPHLVLAGAATHATTEAKDPTLDYSFRVPAKEIHRKGRTLWSDLSYSQLDDTLLPADRRIVLIALRGVEDANQKLLGVIKVGLLEREIRELVANARVNLGDENDPYRIFISDDQGRLITGLGAKDALGEDGDDLRILAADLAPEVKAALAHPALAEAGEGEQAAMFELQGKAFHVSFHPLKNTQDWRLGIVGPTDYYTQFLEPGRRQMLLGVLGVLAFVVIGGLLVLRVITRAFSQIQRETSRMHAFQFTAVPVKSIFADVRETLFSLEQAKTAVRAMGKYVPLALVQGLFAENAEPALGGKLREVTLLFSDIEGFTTRAEEEPPDVVAQWLGRYLEVMTDAVHAQNGTVDKFIGDAVMALWNAPRFSEQHAIEACRAALGSQLKTKELFASQQWGAREPLVTRIGLHVGAVMVGHFGAPDRLSYTAIGDSVNLASRLEGLNKHYGTTILASEELYARARDQFAFRLIDKVAVKGKSNAIGVYELMGPLGQTRVSAEVIARYAEGLRLYVGGDFARARASFEQNAGDPPSVVMAARCAEFQQTPPLAPWHGISAAQSK